LEQKLPRAFVSLPHCLEGLVDAVPLGRYFLWVGSVLLAMFFIADRMWPTAAPAPVNEVVAARAPTDPGNSMILRIQSARKWPDKIVFDTSIPTMVPPPVVAAIAAPAEPVVAPNAAAASPLEARAEMKQAVLPVSPPPKRLAKVHHRNARPVVSTVASAYPSNYPSSWASASPAAPAWSFRW
jgi:hypothetical protein